MLSSHIHKINTQQITSLKIVVTSNLINHSCFVSGRESFRFMFTNWIVHTYLFHRIEFADSFLITDFISAWVCWLHLKFLIWLSDLERLWYVRLTSWWTTLWQPCTPNSSTLQEPYIISNPVITWFLYISRIFCTAPLREWFTGWSFHLPHFLRLCMLVHYTELKHHKHHHGWCIPILKMQHLKLLWM